eukprot:9339398-Lingulodinium_polyedra.AAC.1
MGGSQQGGIWACPVCVRRRSWGTSGARRVFAIRMEDRWRLAYIGGANAEGRFYQIYKGIDADINFIRGL